MNSNNNIKITSEFRQLLAEAVKLIGGCRKFERKGGIATGKISRILNCRIRSITPEVAEKITNVIAKANRDMPGGKLEQEQNLDEIDQARTAKLAQLMGRAEAALEIIEDTEDMDAIETALGIARISLSELYTAAGRYRSQAAAPSSFSSWGDIHE